MVGLFEARLQLFACLAAACESVQIRVPQNVEKVLGPKLDSPYKGMAGRCRASHKCQH